MSDAGLLRFAASRYCNSWPLVDGLTRVDSRVRLRFGHPATLAALLRDGEADVALIPVADYFRHGGLAMVEGLGVSADGVVRSVLLKCHVPVERIRTVVKDPASGTSNALAELLLRRHYGREVTMEPFREGRTADAAVMIGDPALCSEPAACGDIDLAAAWKAFAGLPFVFAVWAFRQGDPREAEFAGITHAAYRAAAGAMPDIIARFAAQLGRPPEFIRDYLTRCIRHRLGERERQGMELFGRLLRDPALTFRGAATAPT